MENSKSLYMCNICDCLYKQEEVEREVNYGSNCCDYDIKFSSNICGHNVSKLYEDDSRYKLLKDVNNKDLHDNYLPDSVGSFLFAFIEEKLKLKWEEVEETMTLGEFIILRKKYKENQRN